MLARSPRIRYYSVRLLASSASCWWCMWCLTATSMCMSHRKSVVPMLRGEPFRCARVGAIVAQAKYLYKYINPRAVWWPHNALQGHIPCLDYARCVAMRLSSAKSIMIKLRVMPHTCGISDMEHAQTPSPWTSKWISAWGASIGVCALVDVTTWRDHTLNL